MKGGRMNHPYSFFPASKPVKDGLYLVHDTIYKKWYVTEWRNKWANRPAGDFQGGYDVDYYVPYRLAKDTQ